MRQSNVCVNLLTQVCRSKNHQDSKCILYHVNISVTNSKMNSFFFPKCSLSLLPLLGQPQQKDKRVNTSFNNILTCSVNFVCKMKTAMNSETGVRTFNNMTSCSGFSELKTSFLKSSTDINRLLYPVICNRQMCSFSLNLEYQGH